MPLELGVKGTLILELHGVVRQLIPKNVTLGALRCFKETLHERFFLFGFFAHTLIVHFQIHTFAIELQRFFLFVKLLHCLFTFGEEFKIEGRLRF